MKQRMQLNMIAMVNDPSLPYKQNSFDLFLVLIMRLDGVVFPNLQKREQLQHHTSQTCPLVAETHTPPHPAKRPGSSRENNIKLKPSWQLLICEQILPFLQTSIIRRILVTSYYLQNTGDHLKTSKNKKALNRIEQ